MQQHWNSYRLISVSARILVRHSPAPRGTSCGLWPKPEEGWTAALHASRGGVLQQAPHQAAHADRAQRSAARRAMGTPPEQGSQTWRRQASTQPPITSARRVPMGGAGAPKTVWDRTAYAPEAAKLATKATKLHLRLRSSSVPAGRSDWFDGSEWPVDAWPEGSYVDATMSKSVAAAMGGAALVFAASPALATTYADASPRGATETLAPAVDTAQAGSDVEVACGQWWWRTHFPVPRRPHNPGGGSGVPELDPAAAGGGMAFLSGLVLVAAGRCRQRR